MSVFNFNGFIKPESVKSLQNPTLHFKNFDIQILKNNFQLKVITNNGLFNAKEVIQTLKYNQLLNDKMNIYKHQFDTLNCKNQKNDLIPLTSCNTMIGCPFMITPLFCQQHQDYHNGHLTPKYIQVKYFKYNCESFNRFVSHLPIAIALDKTLYVKSFYCFLANERSLEKIFFVELIDETLSGENQVHPSDVVACQNHHIKIYKSSLNNKNDEIFEEIETIKLPVLVQIINQNPKPMQDSECFSNAHFDIVTIFKGNLVLYDKIYNLYPYLKFKNSK